PHFTILDFCDIAGKLPLVKAPSLFGLKADFNAEGQRLITSVVAAVEKAEAENPTKNIRKALSLEEVVVRATTVDVWDVAAESPRVQSELRWMELRDDLVQLQVPQRQGPPASERVWVQARRDATAAWRLDRHHPGGWNGRFPVKAHTVEGKKRYDSLDAAVAAADAYLKAARRDVVPLITRHD